MCYINLTKHTFIISVRQGGMLFEHFVESFSAERIRRKWKRAKKAMTDDDVYIDDVVEDELVRDTRVAFFTWVIQSCAVRSTAVNRQLFYLSVLLQFRGLSRNGLRLVSCFNLTLPPTTFDRYRMEELEFIDLNLRSSIPQLTHAS